jgi:hypothetical protein
VSAPEPVEEVLAREAERRPRAGAAAIAGGLLTLLTSIALGLIYSDLPSVYLIDALRDAAGEPIGRPGLRSAQLAFYDDHTPELLGIALLRAVAIAATAMAMMYLAEATRARKPDFPAAARWLTLVGAALLIVGQLGLQVGIAIVSSDFVGSGDQDSQAARDALGSGFLLAMQGVGLAGTFACAFAFVLIPLNAMRVGLLTRFMGILGVIVGVTIVLPLDQQGVIRSFWLVSLGFLLLGRWPNGAPPAWQTGRAEPWPSQQAMREARQQAEPTAPDDPATDAPSPATSKRKRKRRG